MNKDEILNKVSEHIGKDMQMQEHTWKSELWWKKYLREAIRLTAKAKDKELSDLREKLKDITQYWEIIINDIKRKENLIFPSIHRMIDRIFDDALKNHSPQNDVTKQNRGGKRQ